MTQVSTQEELRAALLAREPEIQVTADFDVSTQQNVPYSLLLHSVPGAATYTLSKTAGFSGSLFRVSGGGALTLENLILDGSAAGSYLENAANRTLVQAMGGSIHLGSGAVLQNNSSYQEGGGLYLSGDASYVNSLLMDGDAVIRGCSSRTSGGGLTAALRNNSDSVRLAGTALIEQNTAANGAGVYLRSYLAEVGGALSIGEQVQIRDNRASANGGGVYCSSFSAGGNAALSLTVDGEADISMNQAASGGGLYFYSANSGDRLTLAGPVRIAENTAAENGGGLCLTAPRDSVFLSIQGAAITGNHAGNGGGAYLRATAGGILEVTEQTIFSDNVAAGTASSAGGGLWIQNVSDTLDTTFSNTALLSNRAAANGGGIFLSNSGRIDWNVTGGSISQNAAGASGGGGYLTETSGAAGILNMNDVTVSGNTAAITGGGLCLSSGMGTLESTLDNCTISGNTADASSGGGIWSGGSRDRLFIRSGTVITQNSSEAGNGGGVYFNCDDGTLILSGDAKITYNRADARLSLLGNHGGGICVVPGRVEIRDQVEIASNRAGKFGGGLSAAEESVITISGGSIHDNQSGLEGGGVWNHINSQFTQTGGSIENNTAQIGGGLYNDADSTASILGGVIQGNTAAQYAPGVYNTGILYTQGLRELSNGLYLENRGAIAYLTGALEEGTAIQLENSGYVAPNPAGTPIVVGEATPQYPLLTETDANGFQKPLTGFDGWEIRLSGDSRQVLLALVVYTLQYENSLSAENPNPPSYTVVTPTIMLANLPDTAALRFAGWFDAPEGGIQVTEIPQGSMGDKILYARWQVVKYTVTYYGNDAGGPTAENVPHPQQVQGGESVLLSDERPVRAGFLFTGWNTNPGGTGTAYPPGGAISNILADTGLYAQWEAIPPTLHLLTYEPNDEGGPSAEKIPEQKEITAGGMTELSSTIPTRAGYQFLSWNVAPDGSGTAYQPGQTVGPFHQDLTLYAQWRQPEHTITYHGNEGAAPPAEWVPFPQPAPEGQSVTLSSAIPTREGFVFSGWNTEPAGTGTAYQPGDTIPDVRADIDLYAQWLPLPPKVCDTVTYCGNDTGGPPAHCIPWPQKTPAGQCVQISCRIPYRACYCFAGWNTDPCGRGQTVCPGQTIGPMTGDVFLYAQWRRLPTSKPCCVFRKVPD